MDSEEKREHIGVGIVVLSEDKKRIILGERMNSFKAGWLGMPGGRIEGDEAVIEAAKRELLEEAGVTAQEISQETYSFIHFGFVVSDLSGEVTNMEPDKCKGWQWYSLDSLPEKILPGHRGIIELYKNKEKFLLDLQSNE
jgi:8-oxo-dGTP diphosphatase